jgi:arylsulfatase A-like enzyme
MMLVMSILGLWVSEDLETPHIDNLAKAGYVYRCRLSATVCAPSRAGL